MKLLSKCYLLIIVTNQSGIGRGLYSEEDYFSIRDKLTQILNQDQIKISGEYYCPHHSDGIGKYRLNCNCRKPKTGMLEQAAKDFNLNLEECWMIGDRLTDIQAGQNVNCKTIHVLTGEEKNPISSANFVAKNLIDAANYIFYQHKNT
jgi:D,D-heptose 1,7-bisphosphate phosphatase